MNPADGRLTYLGVYDNKATTFRYHATAGNVTDGVLMAIDASKDYIAENQMYITDDTAPKAAKDLTE